MARSRQSCARCRVWGGTPCGRHVSLAMASPSLLFLKASTLCLETEVLPPSHHHFAVDDGILPALCYKSGELPDFHCRRYEYHPIFSCVGVARLCFLVPPSPTCSQQNMAMAEPVARP